MKQGQVIVLFLLSIGIAGGWWLLQKKPSAGKIKTAMGEKIFPDFPLNDVVQIEIMGKENLVMLAKEEEHWVVKNHYAYAADFVAIADFLKDVSFAKIMQTIDITSDHHGKLELLDPEKKLDQEGTGTKVRFLGENDHLIGTLLLGKQHMGKAEGSAARFGEVPDGRYLYQPESNVVVLVSETFSSITDDPNSWMDSSFIKITNIREAKVEEKGTVLWKIYREKERENLQLDGGLKEDEEVLQDKLNSIDTVFRYSRFTDIADPSISDEEHGFYRDYTAETFSGFTYRISLGKKTDQGNIPIKITINYISPQEPVFPDDVKEEEKETKMKAFRDKCTENEQKFSQEKAQFTNWVYLISANTVDDILLERNQLLKVKPVKTIPPPSSDSPKKGVPFQIQE